ncbi:MAG: hypothetical protein M1817_002397 [Caeruleum heppii]|nr:MAG: hypothetical protein M1817_002397 [Caeruleum heppii]
MAASSSSSFEMQQLEQQAHITSLEFTYEKTIQGAQSIFEEERARRLRLQILLLEDENDDLHDQLAQEESALDAVQMALQDADGRAERAEGGVERVHALLRMRDREIATLKAEVDSLNSVNSNSTKLLTEKFALSHELASLRPELEHLRAQAASHQSVLAEKLSLQRQISTILVELENEKRTAQRLLSKEGKDTAQSSNLQNEVAELRKELAKEKKEREKAEQEARKSASSDWENRRAILESKLDAMRGKLRSTKDRLKETETELEKSQAAVAEAATRPTATTKTAKAPRNPRKRPAAHLDAEQAIGTPDGITNHGRPAKVTKRASALPGDKSTFSVTPFLNRTSMAPDTPPRVEETEASVVDEAPADDDDAAEALPTQDDSPQPAKKKPGPKKSGLTKSEVLGAAKASKGNIKAPIRKRSAAPVLEQVAEEEQDENVQPKADTTTSSSSQSNPKDTTVALKPRLKPIARFPSLSEEPEAKKKKRKLGGGAGGGLGKTLFDEDDAEPMRPLGKIGLGGSKGFPSWAHKGGLAGPKGGLKGGLATGGGAGFGGFSPLKRDRKSAAAE